MESATNCYTEIHYANEEVIMRHFPVPDRVDMRYSDLTPALLQTLGIKLLLSDLDFTLAPKKISRPDGALKQWIEDLRQAGIAVMIVSNNRSGKRVEAFCADLGIPYQGHAGKPSPKGLLAAMERAGATAGETAMLGDKLLTDVLAARRAGVLALMVEPAGGAVTGFQKLLHALQAPGKAACRRKTEKNLDSP
ncbi:MAG: YqeG family HAD IIIA-type phosphatase [Oscillibacter sp.]